MKAGLYAATTAQLEQRRDELLYASGVLEHQLKVVTAALCAREPHGKQLEVGVEHATRAGYLAGCHCTCCCGANAEFQAAARDRKRQLEADRRRFNRNAERRAKMPHPRIGRPKVELLPGPNGMVFAQCAHCEWLEGPSVKTYMQERAVAHRADHRAGRVAVTR